MKMIDRRGVWRLYDRHTTLILTDEKQLERIAYAPDEPLFDDEDRGFSGERHGLYPKGTTLDSFMADAAQRGCTRVEVSYDFFFGGTTRTSYPDSEITVKAYQVICEKARAHGMTFGASLISPLDLGGGYAKTHENTGRTWQMAEADLQDGHFSLEMREQMQWYNNKGPIALRLTRLMAYAFDEERLGDSANFYVNAAAMEDITPSVRFERLAGTEKVTGSGYGYRLMRVSGDCGSAKGHVMVLAEYATPELDYFADNALPYIQSVVDLHAQNGIAYEGFYSDEMHIQFDWDLNEHFGPTEIRTRYVTPSLIREYAARYGEKYLDFARYMVYFCQGQHWVDGKPAQHVMGRGEADIAETWLFRKRYFELLSRTVVDLSKAAKDYAESRFGAPIMAKAHATWQEAPTCDHFCDRTLDIGQTPANVSRYDYGKPYSWSSTIRENMSACGDYFRWNEFLSGAGTDHPEGGYLDRNYYAQAFAASLGNLNPFEKAYCACWGSPAEAIRRFSAVGAAYGTGSLEHSLVQDMRHRESAVLALYPTELNYADERFGSWMVQYGYCDYITEEKLQEFARADGGKLLVNGRAYGTVVALFEPFLAPKTAQLLRAFVMNGGKLLWTAVPAAQFDDGSSAAAWFEDLFGAKGANAARPVSLEDREIRFEGRLAGVAPMTPCTGLLPDMGYPCEAADAQIVARCGETVLGTAKEYPRGGLAVYLGFRPRDDQSQSMGADIDTLFAVLNAMGAYDGSLERLSRPENARYLLNRFPNGAVTVANHYRTFQEAWDGSFFRVEEDDRKALEGRALPPIEIDLNGRVGGCDVVYSGTDALSFCWKDGQLLGFAGNGTTGISLDGHEFRFTDAPASIAFAQMDARHLSSGVRELLLVKCDSPARVRVPIGFVPSGAGVCELDVFETAREIPFTAANGTLSIDVSPEDAGHWIAVYAKA